MIAVEAADLKRMNARLRRLPRELKNDIRRYQRQEATPIWREEMDAKVNATRMGATIFKSGTRVKAGAVITLVAGAGTKKMSGGGTPKELSRVFEFGTQRSGKYTKYHRKSKNGGTHTVTRRASQGIPPFKKTGYTVYPASNVAAKRLTKLAAQTMVRRIYESIEG